MDVGPEEEDADAFVLQEAAAEVEAARREARSSHAVGDAEDIFEMFGDSEGEVKPVVETRAPWRTKATVVESSESELDEQP